MTGPSRPSQGCRFSGLYRHRPVPQLAGPLGRSLMGLVPLRHAALMMLAALVLVLGGCGGGADPASGVPGASPLRVAAASDLQAVLPILAERFGRENGVAVVATFGSSGNLARQVRQGAPFDLFLSANRRYVEELAADGRVERVTVAPYATGVLVLAVHGGAEAPVEGLADLARPEVRAIAMANPDFAPYGVAARQALERAGLWDALGPKLVPADSVRHALQFVETGNAEAGLVALANAQGDPAVRIVSIDPDLYEPIEQTLGVVVGAPRVADARAFARFLLGAAGQQILQQNGFRPISPARARPDESRESSGP